MNYELAKQLKDAGFPQTMKEGDPFFLRGECQFQGQYESDGATYRYDDHPAVNEDYVKSPALEELIEACGLVGFCLYQDKGTHWTAGETDDMGQFNGYDGVGSTPTEAVARLWLALHADRL